MNSSVVAETTEQEIYRIKERSREVHNDGRPQWYNVANRRACRNQYKDWKIWTVDENKSKHLKRNRINSTDITFKILFNCSH